MKKKGKKLQKLEESKEGDLEAPEVQTVPTVPTAAPQQVVQAIPLPQGFYSGNQYVVPVTQSQLD